MPTKTIKATAQNQTRLTEKSASPAAQRKIARTSKRPKKESFTIAYRVDGATLSWLEEKAVPYGLSVHEYARQRLIETIEDTATEDIRGDITDVKHNLSELREDLAVTLEIVLANITGSDPKRIRAWIDDNLRRLD